MLARLGLKRSAFILIYTDICVLCKFKNDSWVCMASNSK